MVRTHAHAPTAKGMRAHKRPRAHGSTTTITKKNKPPPQERSTRTSGKLPRRDKTENTIIAHQPRASGFLRPLPCHLTTIEEPDDPPNTPSRGILSVKIWGEEGVGLWGGSLTSILETNLQNIHAHTRRYRSPYRRHRESRPSPHLPSPPARPLMPIIGATVKSIPSSSFLSRNNKEDKKRASLKRDKNGEKVPTDDIDGPIVNRAGSK